MSTESVTERGRRVIGTWGLRAARRLPRGVQRAVNTARGIDTPHLVGQLDGTRPVVLAPHPDDELIGAGGALRGHVERGLVPSIIHITSGERTAGLAHLAAADRGPTREREAVAAAAALGIGADRVHFLRLPDGGLDAAEDEQASTLSRTLAQLDPDLIYAPWPIDAHRDHTAATALLAVAARTLPPSTRIALYEVWTPLAPTHIVDITTTIDTKIDALGSYGSALESVDYTHTARGLAAYRSAQGMHGVGYAEAFAVLSPAALDELVNLVRR